MKTLEELYNFFKDELYADLTVLENERKAVVRNIYFFSALVIGVGLFLAFIIAQSGGGDNFFFVVGLTFMGVGGVYWLCSRQYASLFKGTIIERLVRFIDPVLIYRQAEFISQGEFEASGIFLQSIDRYYGDDLVEGRIGQTPLRFCELCAQYVTRSRKGAHYHTFFHGLFFIADFNKDFHAKTFVLPDSAEGLLGGLGTMLQKMNIGRPPLVKLEDPEFERVFAVYGEDQVEARYVLSMSLMRRILDFQAKSRKRIALSFVRSQVYIAIDYGRGLFEPRVFKTLLDFTPIREYFEDLSLAVGIVEDLNLNTRLWSKQ